MQKPLVHLLLGNGKQTADGSFMPDISPGYLFTPHEGRPGLTSTKLNAVSNGAVINPSFVSGKPAVSTVTSADQLLLLKADGTYARVPATAVGGGGTGPPPTGAMTFGETPTGAINGTNTSYTSANTFASGKLAVFLNGLRQRIGQDYNVTGTNSFSMLIAPLSGDTLSIDYQS